MNQRKLAFQRWTPGQILEPEQFRAEEEAVVATALLVGELRGLPFHGIARLTMVEAALAEGCISIPKLTAVFPGGPLVDVPGNAVISDLDLTKLEVKTATVYLHLMNEQDVMPRSDAYAADPPVVSRSRNVLRLSLEDFLKGARAVMPLVLIAHDKLGGPFRRVAHFAPPLISIAGHPFLREQLDQVSKSVKELRQSLSAELDDPMFQGERVASARHCEAAAVRVEVMLAERERGIMLHPHTAFDVIRSLWLELLALHEQAPVDVPLYDHDQPAAGFQDLADRIRGLARGEPVRSSSLSFSREVEDQPFLAKPFPPALAQASEVYLVVERSPERTPLGAFKLASPGRLDTVIKQSTTGVEVTHVPTVPFRHTFGHNVDFYRLDMSSVEWKRAVDASAIAFRAVGALAKVRTALYWRSRETGRAS